ncbi:unnamed protein product [Danaus chrysippus]|uniref:(African queen) hypothetical protein n=1 Tax=Danaus chrysippus TaxID=151541 RepID=A0A8J2VZY6_9NEOP|nr:unnamed protein product [Danaus chrysippus]
MLPFVTSLIFELVPKYGITGYWRLYGYVQVPKCLPRRKLDRFSPHLSLCTTRAASEVKEYMTACPRNRAARRCEPPSRYKWNIVNVRAEGVVGAARRVLGLEPARRGSSSSTRGEAPPGTGGRAVNGESARSPYSVRGVDSFHFCKKSIVREHEMR